MAKVVTLDVVIENRHGILSQVIVALSKHGFRVLKQHLEQSADDRSVLSLWLDGKKPVDDAVRDEIRSVKGCIQVDAQSGAKAVGATQTRASASTSDEDIANSLLKAYPNVQGVLTEIVRSTPEPQRDDRLHEFGKAVGRVVYQKRYALGLPVKMPAALKRIVQPEIKAYGKVGVKGNTIEVKESALCHADEERSMCAFVHGLVDGLVGSNPNSKDAEVARVTCLSHGDAACSFEVID